MPRKKVTNWGNYPSVDADVTEPVDAPAAIELLRKSDNLIARGNGRCYGDSSLGENIVSTLRMNKFIAFEPEKATVECQSGVLLSDVLDVVIPHGLFLPVTPGTKFITVGGAIAADVHGKNHHIDGTFSNHVVHLDLLTEEGEIVRCSHDENPDMFFRTCGGMGLTGVILSARFRVKTVETAYIDQTSTKAKDLEAAMRVFDEQAQSSYSVAWLDCLASERALGRSLVQIGEHAWLDQLEGRLADEPLKPAPKSVTSVPFSMPAAMLNAATVKAFNTAYYHRQMDQEKRSLVHFDSFFYPLDRIAHWNRLYGRKGFVQYQFVLPLETSYDGLREILGKIRRSGEGSPLAVLKLFGKPDPRAVMSFPIEGYTLALDFRVSEKVFRLLDELDEIVVKYNGRIYLAKDARMKPEVFRKTYGDRVSSGYFRSMQSARLEF